MSDELRLRLLFSKYLQRACTPQELKEFLSLLDQAGMENELDEELQAVWQETRQNPETDSVDWDKMYKNISHSPEIVLSSHSRRKWLYPSAAAILLLLAGSIYWFTTKPNSSARDSISSAIPPESVKKSPGSRQTIHLPDGSSVVLNTGGKLNYPSSFSAQQRDVYLSGEGFFDIQHDPERPFFVHIGSVTVKVLGTAFNIRAEPGEEQVAITVTRGKVQVFNDDKKLAVLTASQQLSFSRKTEISTTGLVDTLPVIAWKPAEIYFNDISLEEVAQKLEKIYGMPVSFTNPLAQACRVTATFSEDDLVEEILTVICAVSKTEFSITNNKITIHGKGCD